MFRKLVKEHPSLQEYWHKLLEKGKIENKRGSISLVRRYAADERVLIVEDIRNDIFYTVRVGKLEITRNESTDNPLTYTYRVKDNEHYSAEDMEEVFDQHDGLAIAVGDLYRSLDAIIEEYEAEMSFFKRAKKWLSNKINLFFLLIAITYGVVSLILLIAPNF